MGVGRSMASSKEVERAEASENEVPFENQSTAVSYFNGSGCELLPVVISDRIASFLHGNELVNLGKTCKYWYEISKRNSLWKVLVESRFGQQQSNSKVKADSPSQPIDYKKLYFKLSASKISVANGGFYILHLNDHYLSLVNDSESKFGKVLQLNTVCWLQIHKNVDGVLPGKYTLFWRMKLLRVYVNAGSDDERIEFKAIPEAGCGTEACKAWKEEDLKRLERERGQGVWFLQSMGQFEVTTKCKVFIEVKGRIRWWCGGISWDYVELRPHT